MVDPGKELTFYDQVELVKSFYSLGNRLNASGKSEAAITGRARIRWKKFKECGKLLNRKLSLKMKGRICRSCARLAMLHGSETWFQREN